MVLLLPRLSFNYTSSRGPWTPASEVSLSGDSKADNCWQRVVATSICLFGCTSRRYEGRLHTGQAVMATLCMQRLNNAQRDQNKQAT